MIFASANFGISFILELVALVIVGAFIHRYIWVRGVGTFLPSMRDSIATKRETIGSQLAAGEEARAVAVALIATRTEELERARGEARDLVDQTRRAAVQLTEDGKRRADEEYQRFLGRAAVEIELERNRARGTVLAEMGALVLDVAERVVDVELDDQLHRRLIDSTITAAESEQLASAGSGSNVGA